MFRFTSAVLLFTLCLRSNGETVGQTDWSAGPGEAGPVTQWDESFDVSQFVNWAAQPGELTLQTAFEENLIADDFANASFLACADFNNDGWCDVACTSYGDDQLAWFENHGGGVGWTEHLVEAYLPDACVVSTSDIDQDGMPDLVCASEGGDGVCWWRNNDWAGSWTKNEVDTSCNYPFSIEAADFDQDDDIDLCAALYGRGEIVWYCNNDSLGTSWTKHVIKSGFTSAWWAVTDDFNGDGIPDVAGARHGGEINWWENDGTGDFSVEHSITTGYSQCTTIRNCDLNGDDSPDVMASSNTGRIAWWENSSQGGVWIQHIIDDDLQGSWSLWGEDLDNDGDQDVIGNDRKGDCVYWYENLDANGTQWMRRDLNQGMDMSNDVNAADLDNDGFADPIASFGGDGTVYWWKGSELFQPTGSLQSSILDIGQDAEWGEMEWYSSVPSETGIELSVRAGDVPDQLGDWVLIPESGTDLSAFIPDNSRYIQYLVAMTSDCLSESPVLTGLTIHYSAMGIEGEEFQGALMGLAFPNPASVTVTVPINANLAEEGRILFYDQAGRCMTAGVIAPGTSSFSADCSDFPSGNYHILLIRNGRACSAYFMVLN